MEELSTEQGDRKWKVEVIEIGGRWRWTLYKQTMGFWTVMEWDFRETKERALQHARRRHAVLSKKPVTEVFYL